MFIEAHYLDGFIVSSVRIFWCQKGEWAAACRLCGGVGPGGGANAMVVASIAGLKILLTCSITVGFVVKNREVPVIAGPVGS